MKKQYYADYLSLDKLLDCQQTQTADPAHHEHLFIVTHQAYELWFQQILSDLTRICALFDTVPLTDEKLIQIDQHLGRIIAVWTLLIEQIKVLETLDTSDFLTFRDALVPASGFQSVQFKCIETKLGLGVEERLPFDQQAIASRLSKSDLAKLEQAGQQKTLLEQIDNWLARMPFMAQKDYVFWQDYQKEAQNVYQREKNIIEKNTTLTKEESEKELQMLSMNQAQFEAIWDESAYQKLGFKLSQQAFQAALFIHCYHAHPKLAIPHQFLQKLTKLDHLIQTWRFQHAELVRRIIGRKIGTGGTSGYRYLEQNRNHVRFFAELGTIATFLLPMQQGEMPVSLE